MPTEPMSTIKPDFELAWERGYEAIAQEGSMTFQRLREEKGWSREDVHNLTDYQLSPPRQELIEDYQDVPDLDEWVALARIYEMSPGELLDLVLEQADPIAQETQRICDELKDRLRHQVTTLEAVKKAAEVMGLVVLDAYVEGDAVVINFDREDIRKTELKIQAEKG